jgi:hypothetical protein
VRGLLTFSIKVDFVPHFLIHHIPIYQQYARVPTVVSAAFYYRLDVCNLCKLIFQTQFLSNYPTIIIFYLVFDDYPVMMSLEPIDNNLDNEILRIFNLLKNTLPQNLCQGCD